MNFDLDHVGVVVRDFNHAAKAYERLGFNVAPLAYHVRQRPDGSVYQSGTANHCLVMEQGFVELLGVSDPAVHTGWVFDLLNRYEGLHLLGMGIFNLQLAMDSFRRVDSSISMRHLFQTTQAVSSGPMASFNVVDVPENCVSEIRVVAMEHQTREIFFADNFLRHPNGARQLAGATFCVNDVDRVSGELQAMFGCKSETDGVGVRKLRFAPGTVELLSSKGANECHPFSSSLSAPRGVSLTFSVADLDETASLLASRQVAAQRVDGRLLVMPSEGCGVGIAFEAG